MRLLLAGWLLAVYLVVPARADTLWSIKVGSTKLRVLDGNPNEVLSKCACVAGVWSIAKEGGETATHFTGTIDAPSFNHERKATKSMRVKVRKTRSLMGVNRDYRAKLHGIMRSTGHLVLREVDGDEWEVMGFTDDVTVDLFAARADWRTSGKPRPAAAAPFVDPKADAAALLKLINDYRASISLPRVPLSAALTKVAQAHAHDLTINKPMTESCSMHSWSAKGSWTACCYDSSKEAARCMWRKPKEIAGYKGNGYEIAANASGMTPEQALMLWQKSPKHHVVMINKDQWNKPWRALGVAVEGDYAVAWFSDKAE